MNKAESGIEGVAQKLDSLRLAAASKNENNSSDDSDLDNDDEDDEDDLVEAQEVKALFADKVFTKVEELFKYEAKVNGFNLINVVNNYSMGMFDYIKMINFIRKEVGSVIFANFQVND
jgi:hypothetical protein